jgi:hypothetical protein
MSQNPTSSASRTTMFGRGGAAASARQARRATAMRMDDLTLIGKG